MIFVTNAGHKRVVTGSVTPHVELVTGLLALDRGPEVQVRVPLQGRSHGVQQKRTHASFTVEENNGSPKQPSRRDD